MKGLVMKSFFFRERQRYTKFQISSETSSSLEYTGNVLQKLKAIGVVKPVKESSGMDFGEIDLDVSDVDITEGFQHFVFDYVGVVKVNDIVFKIFPKYISASDDLTASLSQVIRAIKKYKAREQIMNLTYGLDNDSPFNQLATMVLIIDDYEVNGPYRNDKVIQESNGEGEIDWEKTINEIDPYIIENRPYYLNLLTFSSCIDNSDYFTRLHTCIAAECLETLRAEGLIKLLSIEGDVFYDGAISDFGSIDYILHRLSKEMDSQFLNRKLMLLKTMYAYISEKQNTNDGYVISMFGTNNMNLVWEEACSAVLGNVLRTDLRSLPIDLSTAYHDRSRNLLVELIPVPLWTAFLPGGRQVTHQAKDTLIPDIVSIFNIGQALIFAIFDAKYYCMQLEEIKVSGQPGMSDITKQYLYQLAFNHFISSHRFDGVINAFLLPGATKVAKLLGKVGVSFVNSVKTDPAIREIYVLRLPADRIFDYYLQHRRIDIGKEFQTLFSPEYCWIAHT